MLLIAMCPNLVLAQTKTVLIEESTGTWCVWCPRGEVYGDSVHHYYEDQAILIAIHEDDVMEQSDYYLQTGLTFFPSGNLDRTVLGSDPDEWLTDIANQLSVVPPADLQVDAAFNASSRLVSIDVEASFFTSVSGDYRIGAVLVEDGVTGPSPMYDQSNAYSGGDFGPMGGYENLSYVVPASDMVYDHVARGLISNYEGASGSLPANPLAGSSYTHSFSWSLASDHQEAYSYVVAFLTNAATGEVLNASRSNYLDGHSNASPFFLEGIVIPALVGQVYSYPIRAHDPDDDALVITASGLPSWLTLADEGDGTAVLSGMPPSTGSYPIVLTVSDGSRSDTKSITIQVVNSPYSWIEVGAPGFGNNAYSLDIDIDPSMGDVYVMGSRSIDELEVFRFDGINWELVATEQNGDPLRASLAVNPVTGEPWIVSVVGTVRVGRAEAGTWVPVGSSFTETSAIKPTISFAPNGTAYVALRAPGTGFAHVYSWDEISWSLAGASSASGTQVAYWYELTISPTGVPHLLYVTGDYPNYYMQVSRMIGSSWETLGDTAVNSASSTFADHDLSVDANGNVFIVVSDGETSQRLDAYLYDGDAWNTIGTDVADGAVESISSAVNAEGELIVGYRDLSAGGRSSCLTYDGLNWTYLGERGFSPTASKQAITLDALGYPVMAYSESALGGRPSVRRFVKLGTNINEPVANDFDFRLWPNPATEQLYIESRATQPITIYSSLGHPVWTGTSNQRVQVGNWNPGIYLVRSTRGVRRFVVL